ncbi:hypothetical protein BO71DRAFT_426731 [Aspergillus ellipticus CBS 707.79]|uniref:Uncharacterized protein n=1 Tax=Aspergillus ellipticus CBS 707.79 TaxID=1448320 RepID=A0A319DK22_9EURO|nr:hypothetical protein BO71DRAFT_426731 [Aspergillus ellipticus CBS 707.79]
MATNDPLLTYIDRLIASSRRNEYRIAHQLSVIIRPLFTEERNPVGVVARRIIEYYVNSRFSQNRDPQFSGEDGLDRFLYKFYDIFFDLARYIHFNDPRQKLLIDLIMELRKLVPGPLQIWKENFLTYDNVPINIRALYRCWADTRVFVPYDNLDSNAGQNNTSRLTLLLQRCNRYTYFSAFIAYCIRDGVLEVDNWLLDLDNPPFFYPAFAIVSCINNQSSHPLIRHSEVLVAANYINVIGRSVHASLIREYWRDRKGVEKGKKIWHEWTTRFRGVIDGLTMYPELVHAHTEALQIMETLDRLPLR